MKFFIFILMLFYGPLSGQNPFTNAISLRSENLFDSTDRATMPFVSEFKVFPAKKRIDWLQNDNSYITSFSISDVRGGWSDLRSDGKLVFSVSYFGRDGQVLIERTGGVTRLGLLILEGTKNLLPLSFSIDKIDDL